MKLILRKAFIVAILLLSSQSVFVLPTKAQSQSNSTLRSVNQKSLISLNSQQLKLLVKAVRPFITNNSFEMQSTLNLKFDFTGGSFEVWVKINTIMEAPQKFRSEITFSDPSGIDGKQYVVVSDGNQVWIHNLKDEQYSVMEYSSFNESDDSFLIGMMSSILSEFWQDIEDIDMLKSFSEDELITALENELGADISEIDYELKELVGNQYATYTFTDEQDGFNMTTFINTSTEEIEYLQINLFDFEDEMSIFMEEKVTQKNILESISPNTFNFIPPSNAQKVDEPISIELF